MTAMQTSFSIFATRAITSFGSGVSKTNAIMDCVRILAPHVYI